MNLPNPKLVTYKELYETLAPLVVGYKWGMDTIRDLWLKGAPVPQDSCPGNRPCKAYPNCSHIRRVLYPNHLETWWKDVAQRQSFEIGADVALRSAGKSD